MRHKLMTAKSVFEMETPSRETAGMTMTTSLINMPAKNTKPIRCDQMLTVSL